MYTTTWTTLKNICWVKEASPSGEPKGRAPNQVFIILPASCSLSIRGHFYHKQICLVKYVTCQLLLGCQGNRAGKLTKGQILMYKVKKILLPLCLQTYTELCILTYYLFRFCSSWLMWFLSYSWNNRDYSRQKDYICCLSSLLFFLSINCAHHLLSVNWKISCENTW